MDFDSLFEGNTFDELGSLIEGMEIPEDIFTTQAEDELEE